MNEDLKKIEESKPVSKGLRRNYCRKCGKSIVSSGHGIIRDICSGCGVMYRTSRRLGSCK